MEQHTQQEHSLETISHRLKELTQERKRVEKANDTFGSFFAPFLEQSEKVPTWKEHMEHVQAAIAGVSCFSTWWEPRHGVYVLIPL